MSPLLLGNIIAFAGSIFMVLTGLIKTKKNILITQNVQFLLMGIGNLILGGVSGFIANLVSIIRNMVCLKWELTVGWKIFFIAIQIGMTWMFNTAGLIGWLPVFAAVIFTWFLDTKSEILIKLLSIFGLVMWTIYDLHFQNYATTAFDFLTIASNIIGIFRVLKDQKNPKVEVEYAGD